MNIEFAAAFFEPPVRFTRLPFFQYIAVEGPVLLGFSIAYSTPATYTSFPATVIEVAYPK
jgi:hypothetical protein